MNRNIIVIWIGLKEECIIPVAYMIQDPEEWKDKISLLPEEVVVITAVKLDVMSEKDALV